MRSSPRTAHHGRRRPPHPVDSSVRSTGLRPRASDRGAAMPMPCAVVVSASSFSASSHELLGELALACGVELLDLVLDRPPVVRLVPVVERVEAEQDRLADELAQHLVRRTHHPAGLRVAQVALELHVPLVARPAAGVEHLVDDVRGVLGRLELDLPGPVQVVGAGDLAGLRGCVVLSSVAWSIAWATDRAKMRQAFVSITASPT